MEIQIIGNPRNTNKRFLGFPVRKSQSHKLEIKQNSNMKLTQQIPNNRLIMVALVLPMFAHVLPILCTLDGMA